jgi:integrase
MARHARSSPLETRENRLKLRRRRKPHFVRIGPGLSLGYRRTKTAGTWVVRIADGKGGNWTEAFGTADDFAEADGRDVLTFWEAQDRARTVARTGNGRGVGDDGDAVPATVATALDRYEADLKIRGGDIANVVRVRTHLSEALAEKRVALLTSRELRQWRDGLVRKELAPASVNRTANALRAALNHAADQDERILSRRSWESGLLSLPDANEARNVILGDGVVREIVAAAYRPSRLAEQAWLTDDDRRNAEEEARRWAGAFGLMVEVAAVTGARISQLARLEVRDLQGGRVDPRLTMPSSKKGKGSKKILRSPVPITAELATRLARNAEGRNASDTLLPKPSGGPWAKSDHSRPFARAVDRVRQKLREEARQRGADDDTIAKAGNELEGVTLYALRHSSIVRMLLAGIPARVVAAHHDTSIAMLEKTYSRFIADHADTLARRALLDTSAPAEGNVVSMAKAAS